MKPNNVIFSTRYNFLKIYANDSGLIAIPSTSSTAPNSVLIATHNLGYIPRARVWYEPIPGEVWPMNRGQYSNNDGGPGTTLTTLGNYYLTTTGLYARIYSSPGGTFKFYWRIYLDE